MVNGEILEANGYKKYSGYISEYFKSLYQKCIRDENGNKKYYIDVLEWDLSELEARAGTRLTGVRYEAKAQLECKDGNTVNIEMLSGWELEDMEKFFEKMFRTGWFQKYDDVY